MHALRIVLTLLVCLSFNAVVAARPLRSEVEVVMFAMPEAVWQAKFEGQFKDNSALWQRLDVEANEARIERPVEMKYLLVGGEPVVQRRGVEKEFVEGWNTRSSNDDAVYPDRKTKRFIGTTIEIKQEEGAEPEQPLRVALSLEHHLAQPVMQRINYANAAVGVERDKLSVEYPQFEKIEWKGELLVGRDWRLVTNILRPQREGAKAVSAMRYVVFIKHP